jgi:DNA-binding response OmpR family regulator
VLVSSAMTAQRALIVEDHPQVASALRPLLQSCSLNVDYVTRCDRAMDRLSRNSYALVVLDRNLPDGDGLDVLRAMHAQSLTSRVLILSERGCVEERIRGLQRGADDYLTKPFSSEEFLARVHALLRREKKPTVYRLEFGQCVLAVREQQLQYGAVQIHLSEREVKLLELLVRHPLHIISREHIANALWSSDKYPSNASLDSFVKRMRYKLHATPLRLHTRYNLGYELHCSA